MDKLVGGVVDTETDPENDFEKEAREDAEDENAGSTGPSSKQIEASESDNSKKAVAVKPFEENKNPNI